MKIDISVRPSSPLPLFRQIVEQICAAIVQGKIRDDEALPSVRALAEQLVVNPNTVARAYSELAREGVVETRQGRGVFVAKRRDVYSKSERIRRIERSVDSLINEAFVLGCSADELVNAVIERARALEPDARHNPAAKSGKQQTRESR